MQPVVTDERRGLRVPVLFLVLSAVLAGQLDVPPEAIGWLLAWLLWPVAGALVLDARPASVIGVLLCSAGVAPGWALLVHGSQLTSPALVAGTALSPALLAVVLIPLASRTERSRAGPSLGLASSSVALALVGLGIAGHVGTLPASLLYLGSGLVAVSPFALAALAITSRQVFFDVALLRALLAVAATVGLLLAWIATVALLAMTDLPDQEVAAGVLTAVGALALLPVWTAARRQLMVRIYGAGRTPGSTHVDLSRQIRRPQDHASLLAALADAVARAVRSPHAEVVLGKAPIGRVAEDGSLGIALEIGDQSVGTLRVAPRSPGERFTGTDQRVLDAVAPQVAAVAQAVLLSQELQVAQDEAVARLEADRRRIYSDLHDVLGPLLAGLGMHVEALRADTARTPDVLPRLSDIAAGVEDCRKAVRRLVQDLRLQSETGTLVDALRALVADWERAADGSGLRFSADVGPVPAAPPAAELALRRVAGEAVTNVVRHAGATRCALTLGTRDGMLELRVEDDGAGAAAAAAGLGITSMRRRMHEVGGEFELEPRSPSGTVVVARVPLGAES